MSGIKGHEISLYLKSCHTISNSRSTIRHFTTPGKGRNGKRKSFPGGDNFDECGIAGQRGLFTLERICLINTVGYTGFGAYTPGYSGGVFLYKKPRYNQSNRAVNSTKKHIYYYSCFLFWAFPGCTSIFI